MTGTRQKTVNKKELQTKKKETEDSPQDLATRVYLTVVFGECQGQRPRTMAAMDHQ